MEAFKLLDRHFWIRSQPSGSNILYQRPVADQARKTTAPHCVSSRENDPSCMRACEPKAARKIAAFAKPTIIEGSAGRSLARACVRACVLPACPTRIRVLVLYLTVDDGLVIFKETFREMKRIYKKPLYYIRLLFHFFCNT
ncbi:hypothetical protein PUN28_017060 [Cardiocondyla obscurior]|uniref:Uncharacterized protein n=1 Tax=Cardiocondyla obscurior TaxID=286306 RepID=A0AAW2ELR9_9HYME